MRQQSPGDYPEIPGKGATMQLTGSAEQITGRENAMLLVTRPGDESLACGGLIAQLCRRGQPPFVMVLEDGTASQPSCPDWPPDRLAAQHARETQSALQCLGLAHDRLLMVGLYDGTLPQSGPVFEAVVRAVIAVMWRTDCNVVCAPWAGSVDAGHRATHRVAAEVAARSGVGHVGYWAGIDTPEGAPPGWRLDTLDQADLKQAAVASHAALRWLVAQDDPAPSVATIARLDERVRSPEIYIGAHGHAVD